MANSVNLWFEEDKKNEKWEEPKIWFVDTNIRQSKNPQLQQWWNEKDYPKYTNNPQFKKWWKGSTTGWELDNYSYLPYSERVNNNKLGRHIIHPNSIDSGKYTGYVRNTTSDKALDIYLASSPDSVDESISASISQESPVGATQPVVIYSSTGARQISISFKVYADYLPDSYGNVKDYCTDFKQLVYPKISDKIIIPPECELYLPGINLIGICSTINISWGSTYRGGTPDNATISFTIIETKKVSNGKVNV